MKIQDIGVRIWRDRRKYLHDLKKKLLHDFPFSIFFFKVNQFIKFRKVNLIELAETLKISKKHIEHTIVHFYLDMLKLFAKWLQRVLTIDQNH
jgi:hypothetical protein